MAPELLSFLSTIMPQYGLSMRPFYGYINGGKYAEVILLFGKSNFTTNDSSATNPTRARTSPLSIAEDFFNRRSLAKVIAKEIANKQKESALMSSQQMYMQSTLKLMTSSKNTTNPTRGTTTSLRLSPSSCAVALAKEQGESALMSSQQMYMQSPPKFMTLSKNATNPTRGININLALPLYQREYDGICTGKARQNARLTTFGQVPFRCGRGCVAAFATNTSVSIRAIWITSLNHVLMILIENAKLQKCVNT